MYPSRLRLSECPGDDVDVVPGRLGNVWSVDRSPPSPVPDRRPRAGVPAPPAETAPDLLPGTECIGDDPVDKGSRDVGAVLDPEGLFSPPGVRI